MILDTSAIIAIARRETDAHRFLDAVLAARAPRMSAATLVECGIVADATAGGAAAHDVDALLDEFGVIVEPVSADHAVLARQAYRRYGKGSGHPARLNYGDTFSYALAKATGEPLLFTGDDFGHTDIRSALA